MDKHAKPSHPNAFADRYDAVLVPVVFEPWARELIRRAERQNGEEILDLACGTGVVTRQIANADVLPGHLVGIDFNAGILTVAQMKARNAGIEAEWVEADARDLPFPDEYFDLAFCQQALQIERLDLRILVRTG